VHALTTTLDLAAAALRSRMQYRVNFVTMVIFGLVYQTTGFLFIWVVLTRFQAIAGWTLAEIAFLYGLRLLAHSLCGVLLGGTSRVRGMVRQGEFDRYLVRPLSPYLQAISINLPSSSFGDLLGGVLLFAAANAMVGIDWSPAAVGFLLLALLGGMLIEAALGLVVTALSFRFLETGALAFFIDDLFNQFGNYPTKIFGGLTQALLTWAVPVAFVAYFPASVLLARTDELSVNPAVAYGAPLVGFVWFAFAYWLWVREMRLYKSAGH
jgi:ABC-2 type transport system permease protein